MMLIPLLVACGGDDDDAASDDNGQNASTVPPGETSPTRAATNTNDAAAAIEAIEFPLELADGMALGEPEAPATLQLFEDFQCPFCLRMTVLWEGLLMEYVEDGRLRLEFRNFPILGDESVYAAAAAVCAAEQDGFWEYHRKLFLVQAEAGQLTNEQLNVGRFDPDALVDYAGVVSLDEAAFATCLQDPASLAAVQEDFTTARNAGLTATPSLLLDGQPLQVPTSEQAWRQVLDEATK